MTPNIEDFSSRVRVLTPRALAGIEVEEGDILKVQQLITPKSLLSQTKFRPPEMIHAVNFPNFRSLASRRLDIINLRLLPVKTHEDRAYYHTLSREELAEGVASYFGEEAMALAPNLYPDSLPSDTLQYLLWIRDLGVPDEQVFSFLAKTMKVAKITENDILMFERPLNTKSRLVRGTLKQFRHIHLLTNMRIDLSQSNASFPSL